MEFEYFINDTYLKLESNDIFDYYVLMKKATKTHICPDGYFYDWYENDYKKDIAYDYIVYYDKEGKKLDQPIEVKIEWMLNKDV